MKIIFLYFSVLFFTTSSCKDKLSNESLKEKSRDSLLELYSGKKDSIIKNTNLGEVDSNDGMTIGIPFESFEECWRDSMKCEWQVGVIKGKKVELNVTKFGRIEIYDKYGFEALNNGIIGEAIPLQLPIDTSKEERVFDLTGISDGEYYLHFMYSELDVDLVYKLRIKTK